MRLEEAAKWLLDNDRFLILSHARPDGDTLGCAAALARSLQAMGKTAYMLENAECTNRYLEYVQPYYAPADYAPEHILSVDCATEELLQKEAECWKGKVELSLDHHPTNSGYAKEVYVCASKAACGEVVFQLLQAMQAPVDSVCATLLYIAVSTDTGCFVYANTNSDTLICAADLLKLGADSVTINKKMFRTKARKRIMIESAVINGMDFYRQGTVAIASITQNMMHRLGATEETVEDIAGIPGQIEGVVVGITLREREDETFKVSVRTMPWVDASAICMKFGGGGHKMAAGCTINATLETSKRLLLDAINEVWPEEETEYRRG